MLHRTKTIIETKPTIIMSATHHESPPSFDIPKKYKAVVYDKPGSISTKVVEHDTPEPGPGEVLIRLSHSGVCHSDMGVMENSWRGLPLPTPEGQVGGHEGVGVVQKLGPGAELGNVKVGDRVGIKWIAYACASCQACLEGEDGVCFVSILVLSNLAVK